MAGPRRILVADGDPDWRARIAEALASPAHEVTPVAERPDALAFAQREKPDLLVTELLLPDMTGLGLCRLLREDPALDHLGIVDGDRASRVGDRPHPRLRDAASTTSSPSRSSRASCSRARRRCCGAARPAREPAGRVVPAYQPAVSLHVNTGTVLVAGERLELTPREFQLLVGADARSRGACSRDAS